MVLLKKNPGTQIVKISLDHEKKIFFWTKNKVKSPFRMDGKRQVGCQMVMSTPCKVGKKLEFKSMSVGK